MFVARVEARCGIWAVLTLAVVCLAVPSFSTSLVAAARVDLHESESTNLEQSWIWQGEPKLAADQSAAAEQRLESARLQLRAQMPSDWGQRSLFERAAWVVAFLHQEVLTGSYNAGQHTVSRALLTGEFNCVSATLLFQYFADEADIPVVPVQTRGHVWSRLLSSPPVDIETTCAKWFAWTDEQRANSPALQNAGQAETLTKARLVAKIPYNLATEAAARQDFAAALGHLNQALRLDPNDTAIQKNHNAILHNWAVQCVLLQDLDQAIVCIRQFAETERSHVDASIPGWHLVETLIHRWCELERFQDAVDLVHSISDEPVLRRLADERKNDWLVKIYTLWIESSLAAGKVSEARNILNWASADLFPAHPALAQLRWRIGQQSK